MRYSLTALHKFYNTIFFKKKLVIPLPNTSLTKSVYSFDLAILDKRLASFNYIKNKGLFRPAYHKTSY